MMILVIQLESFTTHFRSGKTFSIQISKCPTRHKKNHEIMTDLQSHRHFHFLLVFLFFLQSPRLHPAPRQHVLHSVSAL